MTQNENLTVDLSDGPNPICTALLRREPEGGYLRELFGLGQVELVAGVVPDVVLDPVVDWFDVPDPRRPVVVRGLVSATPTGSINLRLREAL